MGFCKFCGEISQGKCTKCGGRAVESIISCMVSDEGRVSVVDRWQSRYEGTILNPEDLVKKSPTAKKVPVTQSTFYDPKKKLCTCCSKVLEFKYSIHMQDGVPYCKDCHVKLFNKGKCPTCEEYVTDKQDFIEYTDKIWHKDCFVCCNCHLALEKDPLVDLENRPCCEPCFMSQAGKKRANVAQSPPKPSGTKSSTRLTYNFDTLSSLKTNDSIRSNGSSSSTSTVNSSVSSSSSHGYSRRPRVDRAFFPTSPPSSSPSTNPPPLTRTPSPKDKDSDKDELPDQLNKRLSITPFQQRLSSIYTSSRTSSSPFPERNIVDTDNPASKNNSKAEDPTALSTSQLPSKPSQHLNKPSSTPKTSLTVSLSQRPCQNCRQPLGDSSQRKVKVPLDNNEYAWFHKACFVCKKCSLPFRNNECVTDGDHFYHPRCDDNNNNNDSGISTNRCQGCQKSIYQDAFQFNGKAYHFQCFRCNYCASHLSLGQPVYDIDGKPYCQFCSSHPRVLEKAVEEQSPLSQPSVNNSSSISNSRRTSMPVTERPQIRCLPKVGGSRICPRCQQAISISDDTPGPLATRWHKKCLRCFTCSKQLDSAAKMRPGKNPNESVVYCRNCSIE